MTISRAENILRKNGYEVTVTTNRLNAVSLNDQSASPIYGALRDGKIESFRVPGREPDRPEFDEFNSFYTTNLAAAMRVAKHRWLD